MQLPLYVPYAIYKALVPKILADQEVPSLERLRLCRSCGE